MTQNKSGFNSDMLFLYFKRALLRDVQLWKRKYHLSLSLFCLFLIFPFVCFFLSVFCCHFLSLCVYLSFCSSVCMFICLLSLSLYVCLSFSLYIYLYHSPTNESSYYEKGLYSHEFIHVYFTFSHKTKACLS